MKKLTQLTFCLFVIISFQSCRQAASTRRSEPSVARICISNCVGTTHSHQPIWPSSDRKDQKWVTEHYAAPTRFINGHRSIPVPQNEANLILVDQSSYRTRLYKRGKLLHEYDVAFGQGKGQKLVEGDNKTPKGMYFVVEKYRGKFDQPYGEYYGGHWIKINYPNRYDAERGRSRQIISPEQASSIATSWERRELTAQDTKLGGGIGFHGWNKEWDNDGPRHLSWECVVMHLKDISDFYDQIPKGTMVVIF